MKSFADEFFGKNSWMIACLILFGFAAYSFMLGGSFKTMDDNFSIVINPEIKSFDYLGKIFQHGFFGDRSYYRPLVSLSFMAEYYFFSLNPLFYNFTNLCIHLMTGIVIFFLISSIFEDRKIGFFTSLLFVIHPVQWEAVSNIAGRSILLCTFFYIFSFWLFYLSAIKKRKTGYYIASLLLFAAALLSKESAMTFPLVILSFVYFLKKLTLSRSSSVVKTVPFFLLALLYMALRHWLGITEVFHWDSLPNIIFGFLTFLRSIITYLRLFVLPVDLYFDRSQRLFSRLMDGELIGTLLFFVALGVVLWRRRKSFNSQILFFSSWFCIGLLTVSQILPISVQEGYLSAAEHFLYLPSLGFFVLMVLSGQWIYQTAVEKKILSKTAGITCIVGLYLFLWLLLIQQNIYSANEITMFKQSLEKNPRNVRMQYSLGLAYAKKWRFKEAEHHFRQALSIDHLNAIARISLGKALCDQGKYFEGIEEYEKVITDDEKYQKLLKDNLRLSYPFLINQYKASLLKDPNNSKLHYSLGIMYSKTGNVTEAIAQYQKALALEPNNKNILFNLGSSYETIGQWQNAIDFYEKMLSIKEESPILDYYGCYHLGLVYKEVGHLGKSKEYFDKSSRLMAQLKKL